MFNQIISTYWYPEIGKEAKQTMPVLQFFKLYTKETLCYATYLHQKEI